MLKPNLKLSKNGNFFADAFLTQFARNRCPKLSKKRRPLGPWPKTQRLVYGMYIRMCMYMCMSEIMRFRLLWSQYQSKQGRFGTSGTTGSTHLAMPRGGRTSRGVCCGGEPKFPKGIFISMVWHDVVNRPGNQGVLISPCQGVVGCMPNLQGFIQVEGNPIRSKMYFLEDLGHTIFSSKTHPHRDQPPTHPFGLWPGTWKQAQETNTGRKTQWLKV